MLMGQVEKQNKSEDGAVQNHEVKAENLQNHDLKVEKK